MPLRDDRISLQQMLDHAREAEQLVGGRRREDLDADRLLSLDLVRLLEIVGEAASRVTEPTRKRLGSVEWSGVIGLRNRLIHGYDEVDLDIVWRIVKAELSPLIAAIEGALASGQ